MQKFSIFMAHCIKKKNEVIILHMHYPTQELAAVFPISILKMHFLYTSDETSLKISGIYKDMKWLLGNLNFRPLNLCDYQFINKLRNK